MIVIFDCQRGAGERLRPSLIVKTEKTVQRSLALPQSLDQAITRVSAENKLCGSGPKNTSAVIREALEQYLERRNSLD